MISVDEAIGVIIGEARLAGEEQIDLEQAAGRIAAADIASRIDQPPFRASAMDGYAVRFGDVERGARLRVIGEAPAGRPSDLKVGNGEAVRIFTGGVVADGADHVIIQEDVVRDGDVITVSAEQEQPAHIRAAGIDFRAGDVLKRKGEPISDIDLGLIAASGTGRVRVCRKPVVAIFDNGDELREPGEELERGQIVGSNRFALAALVSMTGGEPRYLGRAGDNTASIRSILSNGRSADIIVSVGGASVGDHDLVRGAFEAEGGEFLFSKVSVRPGKPTWFGRLGEARVLGLPGNPASAVVCALLFLRPLIMASAGAAQPHPQFAAAMLSDSMPENGPREAFIRGRACINRDGVVEAAPCAAEDSSLYTPLARGNCLIRRAGGAKAAAKGEIVSVLPYSNFEPGAA